MTGDEACQWRHRRSTVHRSLCEFATGVEPRSVTRIVPAPIDIRVVPLPSALSFGARMEFRLEGCLGRAAHSSRKATSPKTEISEAKGEIEITQLDIGQGGPRAFSQGENRVGRDTHSVLASRGKGGAKARKEWRDDDGGQEQERLGSSETDDSYLYFTAFSEFLEFWLTEGTVIHYISKGASGSANYRTHYFIVQISTTGLSVRESQSGDCFEAGAGSSWTVHKFIPENVETEATGVVKHRSPNLNST
ncbi:hypothetical protein B0H13DRAFT_2267709 [Mycena leptocephala]|nr:hypothetical protein B0H13DRAFT_2267709 [Mycena leptocephala]